MVDAAVEDVGGDGGAVHEGDFELLVFVPVLGSVTLTITYQNHMGAVVLQGGVRRAGAEQHRVASDKTRFLTQLTDGGIERRLVFIHHATGDFPGEEAIAEAVLAHHDKLVVGGERQHEHPVGAVHDKKIADASIVGMTAGVAGDLIDFAIRVRGLADDIPGAGGGHDGGRRGGLAAGDDNALSDLKPVGVHGRICVDDGIKRNPVLLGEAGKGVAGADNMDALFGIAAGAGGGGRGGGAGGRRRRGRGAGGGEFFNRSGQLNQFFPVVHDLPVAGIHRCAHLVKRTLDLGGEVSDLGRAGAVGFGEEIDAAAQIGDGLIDFHAGIGVFLELDDQAFLNLARFTLAGKM